MITSQFLLSTHVHVNESNNLLAHFLQTDCMRKVDTKQNVESLIDVATSAIINEIDNYCIFKSKQICITDFLYDC